MDAPGKDEARDHLAGAGTARERLAQHGRPVRTYLLGFAAAALVVFPLTGLTDHPANLIASGASIVLVGALDWWARGRPVTEKGGDRRRTVGLIGYVLLVLAAVVIGQRWFAGEPAYWFPIGVVVAAPLVLAALVPTRR